MAFVHSLRYSFDPIPDFLPPSISRCFIFSRSESAVELQVAHRYHGIGMVACICVLISRRDRKSVV